jgi:hypothetical protein
MRNLVRFDRYIFFRILQMSWRHFLKTIAVNYAFSPAGNLSYGG